MRFLCRLSPLAGAVGLLLCASVRAAELDPRLHITRTQNSGGYSVQGGGGASAEKVALFLKVRAGISKAQLQARYSEAHFGQFTGRVITARFPIDQLTDLLSDDDVLFAKQAVRYQPALDVARSTTITGGVIMGALDPSAASFNNNFGSNVVIGIVDSGIDWDHFDFRFDNDTTKSRIFSFWDQTLSQGPAPGGFTMGTEWTRAQIENEIDGSPAGIVISTDIIGHGTHVAGIAGGDGSDTDGDQPVGTFRGIASSATYIVVKTSFTNSAILDGMNYIINTARSIGLRAVINLSLSAQTGPHDGTGVFESAVNTIAASTPVVVSMGNYQGLDSHASSIVPANGSRQFQISHFGSTSIMDFDFWGVAGDTYTVIVATVATGGTQVTVGPDSNNTVAVDGTNITIFNASISAENGDPNMFIRLDRGGVIPQTQFFFTFQRSINAGTGQLDGWSFDTAFAKFTNFLDSSKTLGSPSDAPNAISVGSYCSKRQWRDNTNTLRTDGNCTAGTFGDISNFSSRGPNRAGAQKPEVTAPGERLASAFSTDMDSPPSAADIAQDGRHRMLQGTSMAAPVVTGIVALKLEANPGITVAQIRSEITAQASTDTKTGTTPAANTWGAGKVRVFGCGTPVTAAPATVSPTTLGVSSVQWTWALAANATSYHLYYATAPSTFIADVSAPPFTLTALLANSTYQLEVRGANSCGAGPSTIATSTSTLATPVGAATLTPTATNISAVYTPLPAAPRQSSSFGYSLEASTAVDFSGTVRSSITALSTLGSLTVAGLDALTTYYLRLGPLNELGAANFSNVGSTFTPTSLVPPTFASFSNESASQIQVNWALGANPAGLEYIAQASTASDFSGTLQSVNTFNLFNAFTGLSANTTYYFQVRATTGTFAVFSPTSTTSGTPSPGSFSSVFLTSFSVAWTNGGNPAGTRYFVESSSDSLFLVGVTSSDTANTSLSLLGLDSNTTHYLRIRARNNGGGLGGAIGMSTATLTNAPTLAGTTFLTVRSSITVAWTPLPLTPQTATSEGYRLEASTATDFSGQLATAVTDDPAATQLSVSGLFSLTTYYLRVGALNFNSQGNFLILGSTFTPDINLSSAIASNTQEVVVSLVPPFAQMDFVEVRVPPGALPADVPITVNASIPFAFNPAQANQGNMTPLGNAVGVDINAAGSQPLAPIGVRMDYVPAALPIGSDPTTIVMANFRDNVWTLLPTTVDTQSGIIRAQTTHFSLFAPFFLSASAALDAVNVFPIPWKPGTGDPAFGALALTFSNLPADGRVKLYTLLGELVWDKSAGASGLITWDGRNKHGRRVGSGTYLTVIEGAGARRVMRVVVIR
jgi:subtilisin family serine protease